MHLATCLRHRINQDDGALSTLGKNLAERHNTTPAGKTCQSLLTVGCASRYHARHKYRHAGQCRTSHIGIADRKLPGNHELTAMRGALSSARQRAGLSEAVHERHRHL